MIFYFYYFCDLLGSSCVAKAEKLSEIVASEGFVISLKAKKVLLRQNQLQGPLAASFFPDKS